MSTNLTSRRDFLKKTAYVAPLVLTMNVSLAEAQVGSAAPAPRGDTYIHSGNDPWWRGIRVFRHRGPSFGWFDRDRD